MSTGTMPRERPLGVVRVEPRLQARRVEVARGQGRRRLRVLVAVLAFVVLVAGACAATRSPLLDVDHVTVRGASHTQATQARSAVGIPLGTPMVSVDAGGAEAELERLPWVASATVSRSWPGTVRITLKERTPVAIVGAGGVAVLVDAEGRALGAAADHALPVVGGEAVEPGKHIAPVRRSVVAILAEMPDSLRAEVARAHASPSGAVLTLTDGITVRWGDSGQATAKIDALRVLLDQTDRDATRIIDVSAPRAATVTPR